MSLSGSKGAYVNVMAWAEDAARFRVIAERNLATLKLVLNELRDPEPWEVRSSAPELAQELFEMAQSIANDTAKVSFGVFHAWMKEGANAWVVESKGQH